MWEYNSLILSVTVLRCYTRVRAAPSLNLPWRPSFLGQALFPPHLLSKIGVFTLLNDKNINFTLSDKDFLLDHLPYGTVEYKWCRVGSGRAGRSLTEWWRAGGDQRRWNQCITNMFVPPLVSVAQWPCRLRQHVIAELYLWPCHSTHFCYGWRWTNMFVPPLVSVAQWPCRPRQHVIVEVYLWPPLDSLRLWLEMNKYIIYISAS